MSVLLGIDLGERRIGVAWGDTHTGSVGPLVTLRRSTPRDDAVALQRLCAERAAEALIVGLPLHLDGRESEQARRTRAWVADVEAHLAVPVRFQDERRTSQTAERRMGRPRRGRSGGAPSPAARRAWRSRIDREAAAEIVQHELDARERASR